MIVGLAKWDDRLRERDVGRLVTAFIIYIFALFFLFQGSSSIAAPMGGGPFAFEFVAIGGILGTVMLIEGLRGKRPGSRQTLEQCRRSQA